MRYLVVLGLLAFVATGCCGMKKQCPMKNHAAMADAAVAQPVASEVEQVAPVVEQAAPEAEAVMPVMDENNAEQPTKEETVPAAETK